MRLPSSHALRPGLVALIDPAVLKRLGAVRVGPSDCFGPHPFVCLWNAGERQWAWTALTSSDNTRGWSAMQNRIAIPAEHRLGDSRLFLLSPCYVHDCRTHWLAHADVWVEASVVDKCKSEMSLSSEILGVILAKTRRAA